MKDLKDRIHHDAVTLKATNDIIESKKKLKAVENKRLEDMHEIEMLKQKEERLIREKETLRAHGIQKDADKQRQHELELQIKACDDRIAQDERHVKEEEDQIGRLKEKLADDELVLADNEKQFHVVESEKKTAVTTTNNDMALQIPAVKSHSTQKSSSGIQDIGGILMTMFS